tara:strand:+ start:24 stop:1064 length:1041 start_codon:yes stop_codon:yes gene_type:complete
MASTYSDRLKLELMETGANANTWGNNTNTNLQTIDAFGAGYLSKSVAGSANVTLTTANSDPTAESSNKVIEFTGTLTGDITVFIPAVENNYIFFNNTSGSFTLTVAPTGHGSNGASILQGAHTVQYCTGDTVVDLFANSLGTVSVKGTANVNSNVTIESNGEVSATSFTGNGAGLDGVTTLDQGTQMVFLESSAPTGWTQNTASTLANATLRVITSGSAGTGGTNDFQSVFASKNTSGTSTVPDVSPLSGGGGTSGSTTLSTPQIASHTHSNPADSNLIGANSNINPTGAHSQPGTNIRSAGGGGGHSHPVSGSAPFSGSMTSSPIGLAVPNMDIKHANVIVCSKD